MKYIIIGLGNFGSSLGSMLTDLGHEVIGVDSDFHKVDAHKDHITSTICIDCTDEHALETLPLNSADMIAVCIGEDFGSSVMITALLKQKKVKRLISRAFSPLHESVFVALGVNEILHPEQEAAEKLVKRISAPDIIDSWQIGQEHSVIEIVAPKRYIGNTVVELDLKRRFEIQLISIIKRRTPEKSIREPYNPGHASDFVYPGTKIEENDVLVIFGHKSNLKKFMGM